MLLPFRMMSRSLGLLQTIGLLLMMAFGGLLLAWQLKAVWPVVISFGLLIYGLLAFSWLLRIEQKHLFSMDQEQVGAYSFSILRDIQLYAWQLISRGFQKDAHHGSALEEIAFSAHSLQQDTERLSENINQQSQLTQTLAVGSEEISHSIADINQRLQIAEQNADQVQQVAIHGNQAMHSVQHTARVSAQRSVDAEASLQSLLEHVDQVSELSELIREVAVQTNLLALNAAIEAARAGEHGRGFAVVADEVRQLAQRSADSGSRIHLHLQALQASAHDVKDGLQAVKHDALETADACDQAAQNFNEVGDGVAVLHDELVLVSEQLTHQSLASDDIAHSISELADIAQDNAAISSQSSKIAQHLHTLCQSEDRRHEH